MGVKKKKAKDGLLEKAYEVEKADVGSGAFATVHRARTRDKARTFAVSRTKTGTVPEVVAIKCIDKAKVDNLTQVEREIEIMKLVEHPHVINLFETFDSAKKIHLVLEYLSGRSLFERSNPLRHTLSAAVPSQRLASFCTP